MEEDMEQQAIEVILTRQLATHLSMPTFLVDAEGRLLHFNEAAEKVLGLRFEEAGKLETDKLGQTFQPVDEDGQPFPEGRLPIQVALEERHPAHSRMMIRTLDGLHRHVAVTAMPLVGQGSRFLGAIAFFWEVES